jgi:hypothetical protein
MTKPQIRRIQQQQKLVEKQKRESIIALDCKAVNV